MGSCNPFLIPFFLFSFADLTFKFVMTKKGISVSPDGKGVCKLDFLNLEHASYLCNMSNFLDQEFVNV